MKKSAKTPRPLMGEIFVEDKRFSDQRFWLDERLEYELLIRLSDPQAPDGKNELDGVLRLTYYNASAEFSATMGHHTLGILPAAQLRDFLSRCVIAGSHPVGAAVDVRAGLYDFDQTVDEKFPTLSGVQVVFYGEKLEIRIGRHVFGSAEGPLVTEFLRRARLRTGLESHSKKAA